MYWVRVYTKEDIVEEHIPGTHRLRLKLKDRIIEQDYSLMAQKHMVKDRAQKLLLAGASSMPMKTVALLDTLHNAISCPLEDAPKLLGYEDIRSKIAAIRLANGE